MPQGEVKPPRKIDKDATLLLDAWTGILIVKKNDPELPPGTTVQYYTFYEPDYSPGNCHNYDKLRSPAAGNWIAILRGENAGGCV